MNASFIKTLISLSLGLLMMAMASGTSAQEQNGQDQVLLRWAAQPGSSFVYTVSSSGTRNDRISISTEDFRVGVDDVADGKIFFTAQGETVQDSAPLAFRFQRALFGDFPFTVDEMGHTESVKGQPFPVFLNIPILPEGAVGIASEWSGGPVGILPDTNVGPIPFEYTSSVANMAEFKGLMCAVIETDYTVALPADAKSYMPFLGLVQGDEPEEPGQGAPIGGIVENSPAALAGILPGDVVTEAEGQKIRGWGGLEEILPVLVPDRSVHFVIRRGDEDIDIEVTPEAVPLAIIAGTGGLHSTCYFSLDRGMPVKIDLVSRDLVFTLTNASGMSEQRKAELHLTLEMKFSGDTE